MVHNNSPASARHENAQAHATTDLGETNDFVTVAVDCTPEYDATNGVISAVAKCGVDGICQ
jgi:hypothetical protein